MRPSSLFYKTLRDMRWQVFWYGLAFALMAAMIVFIYPSYKDQLAELELPEAFQALLGESVDYASPKGFVTAEFFSWIPILIVIFAVMQGTNLLGGEEAGGTMDVLLAQPISRTRLLLVKLAAFTVATVGVLAIACLGWLLSVPFVDIDVSMGLLALATFSMAPIALMFGSLGLWASVALQSRQDATGFVTGVAVLTYFINYLAALVQVIEPLKWLSPFYYGNAGAVLTGSGAEVARLAVPLVAAVVLSLLAVRAFEGRDIGARSGRSLLSILRRQAVAG